MFFHFLKVCMPKMLEQKLWNLPKTKRCFFLFKLPIQKTFKSSIFWFSKGDPPRPSSKLQKKHVFFFDFTTLGI